MPMKAGCEKLIDDPVMVDGKFVRNVGSTITPSIYKYIYLKDGDKDVLKRFNLAIRVGASLGVVVGGLHIIYFGKKPKWPTKHDPFIRFGFSCLNGSVAMMLHAGTVSVTSQLLGGRDLVSNWALGGFVSGMYIYGTVRRTPYRMTFLPRVPVALALTGALTKVATMYDKPLHGPETTTYGVQACDRTTGPRHYATINPYARQEEYYLEKYL